jgi:Uma2 family endonuclease
MAADPSHLSFAEFLAWESRQEARHEYADGEIVALAGGTADHTTIALNVASAMKASLRGGPCRAFLSDILVEISSGRFGRYPDVTVSCDSADQGTVTTIRSPRVIVEVISESSEARDRGEKFEEYILLPSLVEYALIDSRRQHVTVFRRRDDVWTLAQTTDTGPLEFASLGIRIDFDAVYEDTSLAAAGQA